MLVPPSQVRRYRPSRRRRLAPCTATALARRRCSAPSPPGRPARSGESSLSFLGPGYLVAVGYMDPGNWATSLAGGSKFGYALLTVALLSNLMAILLQALCARLGIGAGPRSGAGLPRRVSARGVVAALGAGRNRDLRHRPCRGDRHRDRAQSAVRHSARNRRDDHRARRVPHPVAAEPRLSLDRGVHCDAARRHHGLLCDPDRDGRSGLGRGDPRLRADHGDRHAIPTCSISRSASSARR